MKNNLIITVIIGVVAAGVGFFGGTKYQESKQPVSNRQFGNGSGGGGQGGVGQYRGGRAGGGQVVGEIISMDDKSITIKLQDGSSKIVLLSDTTSINKSSAGSKSDLKTGERVGVFGATNSDGSVTAQNIQLNPNFRRPTGGAENSR